MKKTTAAKSLVRSVDKLRKIQQSGQDTSKQERKVKTATNLFINAKKKS